MYLLHSYPDRFVIEPDSSSSGASSTNNASWHIMRTTNNIAQYFNSNYASVNPGAYSEKIHGVIGIITLLRGRYLIVMTSSRPVASVQSSLIYQVLDTKIIPFQQKNDTILPPTLQNDEAKYLSLLHSILNNGYFYFSYTYDLFNTTQAQATSTSKETCLWKKLDTTFFWNQYVSAPLIESGQCDDLILPLLNGYIYQQHLKYKGYDINFLLISRRSHERTGKRYITRGIDAAGNVANYAETEQVMYISNTPSNINVVSYVQTRGSIPVYWQQLVNLKYTPKIQISTDDKQTHSAFRKHFDTQISKYGKQTCLNLVNQKGAELELVKAFKKEVDHASDTNIRLVNWDFHHECRKMKYENISKLYDIIKDDVENASYFSASVSQKNGAYVWDVQSTQKGCLRTNCIDCLDRTNVVQSVFAKRALEKQLTKFVGYSGEKFEELDTMFRTVWANNADAMSFQYSGTGALKTDYTRTGKRTLKGAVADFMNSATRYYLNNFQDGTYQDSVDLFLGLYRPHPTQPSPYAIASQSTHPAHQKSLLALMSRFTMAMFIMIGLWTAFMPATLSPHRNWSMSTQCLVFVSLEAAVAVQFIKRYGRAYANKPILKQAANL